MPLAEDRSILEQKKLRKISNQLRNQRYALVLNTDVPEVAKDSLAAIQRFYGSLEPDKAGGGRLRAHVALVKRGDSWIVDRSVTTYMQPALENPDAEGNARSFGTVPDRIVAESALQDLLRWDVAVSREQTFKSLKNVMVELHCVRYASRGAPAWSSPIGLHADNEVIVFVHLIALHPGLMGGDNLLAGDDFATPERVVQLKNPLDTLALAHHKVHAVTPMQSRCSGRLAYRDVLLVTLKPRTR